MDTHVKLIDKLEDQITERDEKIKSYEKALSKYEEIIQSYQKRIEENDKDISSLVKLIADLKMISDTHSGAILHLQESTKQISQKITKQPTVIHDKCFIS
jgi:chromosome segregation ATPase